MRLDIRPGAAPTLTAPTANASMRSNTITWTVPDDPTYAGAEIWRSTTNDRTTATKIANVRGTNVYTDADSIDPTLTYYYWIRAVNIYGRADGPWTTAVSAKSKLATSLDIAASAVKAAMLDVAAIDSATGALAANSVGVTQVTDSAITTQKLAANSVTAGKIASRTITAAQISASAITAYEIAANTITAAEISSSYVYAGTIQASQITAGTMTGQTIQTSTDTTNGCVILNEGSSNSLRVYSGGRRVVQIGRYGSGGPAIDITYSNNGYAALNVNNAGNNFGLICSGIHGAAFSANGADGVGMSTTGGSNNAAIVINGGGKGIVQSAGGTNYLFMTVPSTDNGYSLGHSAFRWSAIYAATSTISTSDERTKTDIENSDLGLSFIQSLRPVKYRLKEASNDVEIEQVEPTPEDLIPEPRKKVTPREGKRHHYGLIAQEVRQAMTSAGIDDAAFWVLEDPNDQNSRQALRYEEFIAPLIKAVQEVTCLVDKQRQRIDELERKILTMSFQDKS